jgi:diguanylate cyclase (GGDEF)-like protein
MISEMLRTNWTVGLAFTHAERVEDANHELAAGSVSAVILGDVERFAVLEHVRLVAASVPVIVLSDEYSDGEAVLALRAGAQDFISRQQVSAQALRQALLFALERKRSEVQLAHRALQDPLTGLPNRTLFVDRLGLALDRARRTGLVTAVLFLDVDGFKLINDTLGHAAGDRVLTAMGGRLRSVLRPMDTVARFGGDEFTFLFEDLSDAAEALTIAERVRQAASFPVALESGQQHLTVSIGVATATTPGVTPEDLIRDADAAMYESKNQGGGSAIVSDDPPEELPPPVPHPFGRAELAAELQRALDQSQLHVLYQPRYKLIGDGRVAGFEALLRWEHPERGAIPPGDFIPVAEEMGVLDALGRFVLGQALPVAVRLRQTHKDLILTVNLSARQLAQADIASALAAVQAAGLQPEAICVDISETAVSDDPDAAIRAARELRAAGIKVAIDDYGTGAASLQSLRRVHADEIKIHESFVGELDAHPPDGAVVGAVVELGHALGMKVTAEGVETDEQLIVLRALGCDGAQGYHLCRPVGAEQLEAMIMHGE